MKKLTILAVLVMGLLLASCDQHPNQTIGVLYVLNHSKVDTITLINVKNDSLDVPRGGYGKGEVYLATICGTWDKHGSSYRVMNSPFTDDLKMKSVIMEGIEYPLTDSLAMSFRKVHTYFKKTDTREEYLYTLDDPFVELVKSTCK